MLPYDQFRECKFGIHKTPIRAKNLNWQSCIFLPHIVSKNVRNLCQHFFLQGQAKRAMFWTAEWFFKLQKPKIVQILCSAQFSAKKNRKKPALFCPPPPDTENCHFIHRHIWILPMSVVFASKTVFCMENTYFFTVATRGEYFLWKAKKDLNLYYRIFI